MRTFFRLFFFLGHKMLRGGAGGSLEFLDGACGGDASPHVHHSLHGCSEPPPLAITASRLMGPHVNAAQRYGDDAWLCHDFFGKKNKIGDGNGPGRGANHTTYLALSNAARTPTS
jgi:hypothetical protein